MRKSLSTELLNVCLLSDDEINLMRTVFKELDKSGDLAINRKLLFISMRRDLKLSQILGNPAVYAKSSDS